MLISLAEQGYLPDWLIRVGIRRLCADRLRLQNRQQPNGENPTTAQFANWLRQQPLAVETEKANEQHYEVPAQFFARCLGPRRKYSCCWFDSPKSTLAEAEEAMLRLTCERAEITDGMTLLDLGCGWGSLTLWLAEKYPQAKILAISNSHSQREYIQAQCRQRGFTHVEVQTCDMREFSTDRRFDRILSIEMFEHLRNYEVVFGRVATWLAPAGKVFLHVFTHRTLAYTFEAEGEENWMGRHFFTGGLMLAEDLFSFFSRDLQIQQQWRVSGEHYWRTSEAWLNNLDQHQGELKSLLASSNPTQGVSDSPAILLQRWRIFFLACAELFRYNQGNEWGVTHYLLSRSGG